jgi:hypothetical protein
MIQGCTTIVAYALAFVLIGRSFRDGGSFAIARIAQAALDRTLLTLALAGPVNLIMTSTVVGVAFGELPTPIGPLGLGVAGPGTGRFVGLLLVLALSLRMNLRIQLNDAEA